MFEKLFQAAISHNANDVHVSVGAPPVLRVGGQLVRLKTGDLTVEDIDGIMRALTPPSCMVMLSKTGNTDYSYDYDNHRFRITVFRQRGKVGMVMRHFRNILFTPQELRIPRQVCEKVLHSKGLFLASGPTGSGKTTTIASIIDLINQNQGKHIITIEDPVELLHPHKTSLITQREIGTDVKSFVDGLHWSMRQDPDVIVVGEIRDQETARVSLRAADTGHLVMGTIHARSCASTITRIISEFPSEEQPFIRMQLAEALLGITNQALVPTFDNRGVLSIMEIMMNSSTISSLIRQEKENLITDEIRKGKALGMMDFEENLWNACVSKEVSFQKALYFSRDQKRFQERMAGK